MAAQVRVSLDEALAHFAELEDPRSEVNRLHPLPGVIVIALMGVLAGAGGPTAIAEWARNKKDLLLKYLDLPNGIPRKDVFRRVLAALKPETFQLCFAQWLDGLRAAAAEATGVSQPVVAIDGKTSRRSHDKKKGLGPLHVVSAWASEYGLSLGQVAADEKSNEITAIPELLRLIDLSGAIITIDAAGTQKAIAKQIIAGGGDYVLALKGNHQGLNDSVRAYAERQDRDGWKGVPARRHTTVEKSHGRIERREYIQFPVPDDLPDREKWAGLKTIGRVTRTCEVNGKTSVETRYFLSSLPMGVKRFAHGARSHWGIETGCHWSLDVTYREDESRTREPHLRETFAWLHRFTLSLLKQHPGKQSIYMKRRICGWNENYLMEVLVGTSS